MNAPPRPPAADAPGNRQLAAALRQRAADHPGGSLDRKALLVAAVVLAETRTQTAARRLLAREHVPEDVRPRAEQVLDHLTDTTR
ncbi:hypothetical protein [Nocardiopsis suaedae]|uniref:ANTAR domain-containing protein n=1 Tax=Nocardiopsis suaedae TaxID=3018444 RepID=A0ABT4TM02_9ACTN|nr:hypothetical protein [Nocardiopsis suaedae]MDA2805727.1 hypothetical protein [Nocardiopsis suaedae]